MTASDLYCRTNKNSVLCALNEICFKITSHTVLLQLCCNILNHHTHTQPFYGCLVTHSHLSWSSIVPYLLHPSNTIRQYNINSLHVTVMPVASNWYTYMTASLCFFTCSDGQPSCYLIAELKYLHIVKAFSALTLLVGWQEGHRPVKNWLVGCCVVICLGRGAYLHMAQLMPLPLTVSCSSKSRLVLPFWFYLPSAGSPR